MGNACSSADENAADIAKLAEGAAAGARQALADKFAAVSRAGGRGVVAGSVPAGAGDDEEVIAGVLSLADGQDAAAEGAIIGLDAIRRRVRSTQRPISDLEALKAAAACGSAAGLRAVATMAARRRNAARVGGNVDLENPDIPEENPEFMFSAVATAARTAALSAPTHLAVAGEGSHTRYAAILGPILGGGLPVAGGVYVFLRSSAVVWIKELVFGLVAMGYCVACTGAIIGSFGRTQGTLQYSRYATMLTFTIIWILLAFGMASLFESSTARIFCGCGGGLLIVGFLFSWIYYGW
uniref:Uncharacterized protein n=1 Tax=Oryza punctata TaxID=4537 RepID=A0A0E0LHI2_ORYPU